MSGTNVFINKTSNSYPVFNNASATTQIGNILANEIYGAADPHTFDYVNGTGIIFRNASGNRTNGFLRWSTSASQFPTQLFRYIHDFPLETLTVAGRSRAIFRARRQITLLRPNGTNGDVIPANTKISLAYSGNSTFAGETNMDAIAVSHWQNSSGTWVAVLSSGNFSHAFCPIGLNHGSGASSINLIGTL